MNKVYLIIPAAGSGTRMGGSVNKLFLEVKGVPVITRTLRAFAACADLADIEAVVVTGEDNIPPITSIVEKEGFSFVKRVVPGGNTRTESVYKGFLAVKDLGAREDDCVFVHDGARCMVDRTVFSNCLAGLQRNPVCVAAVKAKNTIKILENGFVSFTPRRDDLAEIQTPQCFRLKVLEESYDLAIKDNLEATDDTSLSEHAGYKTLVVEGSYSNIKITTPEDIRIAESLV